jgi:deazaflavin-dependent oxidoreductase (nitroreductase family)
MSELDDAVIAEFRANGGVVTESMGGHFKNTILALVHHVGRRSGKEHTTPLLCMADGDNYVLLGSNGGAQAEPQWVANLAAMTETTIELGQRTFTARPTVLREGAEHERLYAKVTEFWPDVTSYERNTDRRFAVVVLEPR